MREEDVVSSVLRNETRVEVLASILQKGNIKYNRAMAANPNLGIILPS